MKMRIQMKRTMVFILVFSLLLTFTQPRTRVKANPLLIIGINLFFLAVDVVNCINDEDKFTGCVLPLTLDALTLYAPVKSKYSNIMLSQFKKGVTANKVVSTVKVSKTISGLKKSKNLILGNYKELGKFVSEHNKLNKIKGQIVHAHHILEHRGKQLASALKIDVNDMISVVLDEDVHRIITKNWRKALPYTKDYQNKVKYLLKYNKAINKVYAEFPLLKKIAKYELFASPGFWDGIKKIQMTAMGTNMGYHGGYHGLKNIDIQPLIDKYVKPNRAFSMDNTVLMDYIQDFDPDVVEKEIEDRLGINLEAALLSEEMNDASNGNTTIDESINMEEWSFQDATNWPYTNTATWPFNNNQSWPSDILSAENKDYKPIPGTSDILSIENKDYKSIPGTLDIDRNEDMSDEDKSYFIGDLNKKVTKGLKAPDFSNLDRLVSDGYDLSHIENNNGTVSDEVKNYYIGDFSKKVTRGLRAPDTGDGATSETYVTNRFFYMSQYIRGYYTGSWKDGKPHGYGKLVYDDASRFREVGGREYVGNFENGLSMGRGKRIFEQYTLDGQFYGLFEKDKLVFEGKIIYNPDVENGRVYYVKQIATGTDTCKLVDWQCIAP